MDQLTLQLNPLSRLKIYQAVQKIVLQKMNNDAITAGRAVEVVTYLKKEIVKIKSAALAEKFLAEITAKFPEINNLMEIFEQQTAEKFDSLIAEIIDQFMEKNDMEKVDTLLAEQRKYCDAKSKRKFITDLQKSNPGEYAVALKKLS